MSNETTLQVYANMPASVVDIDKSAPFGWRPVGILSLVSLADRVEFSMLAGALTSIQSTFHIDDSAAGWLSSGAGIASVLLIIPAGRLADRVHRVRAIAGVVMIWAVLTFATGIAPSFAILLLIRILIGGVSLIYNPAASSLIADFYPTGTRSRAFGIERFMFFLGNPIGIIAGGIIAQTVGWRWAFIGLAPIIVLVGLLSTRLREPIRGTGDRIDVLRHAQVAGTASLPVADVEFEPSPLVDAESALGAALGGDPHGIDTTADEHPAVRDMLQLLRAPRLRAVYIGLFILFGALGGLFFWLPTYYQRAFGLPEGAAAGMAGGVGLIGMAVGTFIGARRGDRPSPDRVHARLRLGTFGLALGVAGLAVGVVGGLLPFQLIGFLIANLGFGIAIPNLTAATADLAGFARRGMAFALLQFVIGLGSAIGPVTVGAASDLTGSLRIAFGVLLIPLVIAVLAVRHSIRIRSSE